MSGDILFKTRNELGTSIKQMQEIEDERLRNLALAKLSLLMPRVLDKIPTHLEVRDSGEGLLIDIDRDTYNQHYIEAIKTIVAKDLFDQLSRNHEHIFKEIYDYIVEKSGIKVDPRYFGITWQGTNEISIVTPRGDPIITLSIEGDSLPLEIRPRFYIPRTR